MATQLPLRKYVVFIILETLCLSCVADSISVEVNITINSNDPTDQRLPNDINVTFSTATNSSTEFRMIRVDYDSLPIYSIETDQDGQKIIRENVSSNENVAFYQDTNKRAVIQLSRDNRDDGQVDELIITKGHYRQENITYLIQPLSRSKRESYENNSQSDQRYDMKPVLPPTIEMSDFLVPPLEQHSSIQSKMEGQRPLGSKFKRRRRQAFPTYYIDVTAFLDSTCYGRFLRAAFYDFATAMKNIREYYAFVFTDIDLIYQNFQYIKFKLRVRLTKVVIFKSSSDFLLTYINRTGYVDAAAVLNDFSNFLNSIRGKDLVFPYDHAMLFVGADLYKSSVNLAGLAWMSTICRMDGFSSSLIEDMGDYNAVIYAAHELGHSLSAEHDGTNNACPSSDRYLMAPSTTFSTAVTANHPWRFSTCTVNYFISHLTALADTSSGKMCLSDTLEIIGDFPDVSQRLLGKEIPRDKQCQMRFGPSSSVCENVSGNLMQSGCSGMFCFDPSTKSSCYYQVPLSGTTCGCGKVCDQGLCVFTALGCSNKDIWSNCTRSMEFCSNYPYLYYCQDTCSNYVSKAPVPTRTTIKSMPDCFDDVNFDYYGLTCPLITPTLCNYPSVKLACCSTCRQWTTTTPARTSTTSTTTTTAQTAMTCEDDPDFFMSGLSCANAMKLFTNYCYDSAVNSSCCASCAKKYTQIPGCEFGDRESILCHRTTACQNYSQECCQSCRSDGLSLKGTHLLDLIVLIMVTYIFNILRSL